MKAIALLAVTALLLASVAALHAADRPLLAETPMLTEIADGLAFGGGTKPRVRFIGSPQAGYDVVFERRGTGCIEEHAGHGCRLPKR